MQLDFTNNIKRLLKEKGIKIKDFAEMLNITPESLSRAINQEFPQLQTIKKMAEVLNVEPSEILFGIKDNDQQQPNNICPHCGKRIKISIEPE